jgi:hypothetical protein
MRMLSRLLSAFTLVTLSVTFMMCGSDPGTDPPAEPTEVEKATEMLTSGTATWAPSASAGIIMDGSDVTAEFFTGFSIKFSATTFTTTGDTPFFEATDTWTFKDETAKVIVRGSDGKEMPITSLTDTQLKFTLEWDQTTYEEGRKKSIPGTYEFTLTK